MTDGRAKERIADQMDSPSAALIDTGRAVFPFELLAVVARAQERHSSTTRPVGSQRNATIFPLAFLTTCAHCAALAEREENPKLRARIGGHNLRGKLRYQHSEGRCCPGKAKSVPAEVLEGDFLRLVSVLDVHPKSMALMEELALQSISGPASQQAELEEKRRVAVAKHRRALRNNLILFQNGEIEPDEYYRQKAYQETQIAYWEAQTTDHQQVMVELTTCIELLRRLKDFWETSEPEDRRMLAHTLFDEIVYDLDTRRIVDFKIKPWAEPILVLRAELYEDDLSEEMKSRFNGGSSSAAQFVDPSGSKGPTILILVVGSTVVSALRRIKHRFVTSDPA